MSIIKIKNSSDNTWMDVLGIPGKSAYKIALENGYTGTEIEFGDSLKKMAQTNLTNYDVAYTHSQSTHAPANAQKNSDITKSEIETKLAGTITTHNHDTSYSPLSHASNTTVHITANERNTWNSKSNFDGNYNNLTNKPILYLTGTEASPIVLWKLDTGFYVITGYIKFNNDNIVNVTVNAVFNIYNYKQSETNSIIRALCLNDMYAIYHSYNYNKTNETIEYMSDIMVTEYYMTIFLDTKVDKVEGKSLSTNDLTNILKTNYDVAYTHSQTSHAPSTAQANSDITKAEIEAKLTGNITTHNHTDDMVETKIYNSMLGLTNDKYQITTMETGTTIMFPWVFGFTEIHLFFYASTDMDLTFPSCKWQNTPKITGGKYYELIFTCVDADNDIWLGGCISYE